MLVLERADRAGCPQAGYPAKTLLGSLAMHLENPPQCSAVSPLLLLVAEHPQLPSGAS